MFLKVFAKGGEPEGGGPDGGPGTGLGLAIAKGIMEAHGGAIKGESPAETGAALYHELPRAKNPRMSAKIHVLVIDDEAAILRFLKPALEANNYEMTSAGTIAEGIKRIAAVPIRQPQIEQDDIGCLGGNPFNTLCDRPGTCHFIVVGFERRLEKAEDCSLIVNDQHANFCAHAGGSSRGNVMIKRAPRPFSAGLSPLIAPP